MAVAVAAAGVWWAEPAAAAAVGMPERLTVAPGPGGGVNELSLSGSGRVVVWHGKAFGLVDWQAHGRQPPGSDPMIWTEAAGIRLAYEAGRAPRDDSGLRPDVSGDGRFVSWVTRSSRPSTGATEEPATETGTDVYLFDRQAGTAERVSVPFPGQPDNDSSTTYYGHSSVSGDGSVVAFESKAANLVGPSPFRGWSYVRDRTRGTTEVVAPTLDGSPPDGVVALGAHAVSADGRWIAFTSNASNLVAGDSNGMTDVFVRDRLLGVTELVSRNSQGDQARPLRPFGDSTYVGAPAVSDDGRYVVWDTESPNLDLGVDGRADDYPDVFLHDRRTAKTRQLSVTPDSTSLGAGSYESLDPAISGDGSLVCFLTRGAVPSIETQDIMLYATGPRELTRAPVRDARDCALDQRGRTLVFKSRDHPDNPDVYEAYRLRLH